MRSGCWLVGMVVFRTENFVAGTDVVVMGDVTMEAFDGRSSKKCTR